MDDAAIKIKKSKAAIRQTFDAVADAYGRGGAHFFHDAGQVMADLLPLGGHEQVLDVACGTGSTALPLARRLSVGAVTGVDLSTGMLAEAKKSAQENGLHNIDFQAADMTALPFEEDTFDHAVCSFGLFFLEDMSGLLAHIASKVKPGGRVIVSGFCGESFMPGGQLSFERLRAYGIEVPDKPMGWKLMAEPEQLQALFDSAGLASLDITRKSLGYHTDLNGWWEVMWNAGFRGLMAQLGDDLERFKQEHLAEMAALADDQGIWLEVDVNFSQGVVG